MKTRATLILLASVGLLVAACSSAPTDDVDQQRPGSSKTAMIAPTCDEESVAPSAIVPMAVGTACRDRRVNVPRVSDTNSSCPSSRAACDTACQALGCAGCDNSTIGWTNNECYGVYQNDSRGCPLPNAPAAACR